MKRIQIICLPIMFLLLFCAEATEKKKPRLILKFQPTQKEFLGNVFTWNYKIENFDDKNKTLSLCFSIKEKDPIAHDYCKSFKHLHRNKEGKVLFGFIENMAPPTLNVPDQSKNIIIQYGDEFSYSKSLIPISIPGAIGISKNIDIELGQEKVLVNFDMPYSSKSDSNTFLYKSCGTPEYKTGKKITLSIELIEDIPEPENFLVKNNKASVKFNLAPDSGLLSMDVSDLKKLLKSAMDNRDNAMKKYNAGLVSLDELNKYQAELVRVQKAIKEKKDRR